MTGYYALPINGFLRDPPNDGARRSAYEVEVNPWSRRGEVEAALLFRGAIVSAYGYIEFRLTDVAIRSSRIPEYARLRPGFPRRLGKRISFLREVFRTGPLSGFNSPASLFLDRVEAASDVRNMMAHATMQVLPEWGVTFHHVPDSKPDSIQIDMERLTIAQLEERAWQMTRLGRLCQHLGDRLDLSGLLPAR